MTSSWVGGVADVVQDLVPFARPVGYAYKYRHDIHKQWVKMLISLSKGSPDILVTGTSGAGKSVLMSHYHGEANQLSWVVPGSSKSTEIKPITIGDWTKIVHVLPGQNGFEKVSALDVGLGKTNGLGGVIHVVDWGYTAIRDAAVRSQLADVESVKTIEDLRLRNLGLELNEFKYICDNIKRSFVAGRGPKWLVIAVNKVDLYMSELAEAQRYYSSNEVSDFRKILSELLMDVGRHNLKCLVLPVCSMPSSYEWNGQIKKPQLDSVEDQRAYMRRFVDEVGQISK